MRKQLMYAIVFILLIASVSAIGISPARKYITYEIGSEENVKLRILNDGRPTKVSLYATGELAKYVEFSKNLLIFEEGDQVHEVTYKVRPPQGMKPGLHETNIIALQLPDDGFDEKNIEKTTIVATTAVASKLQVQVPYPGKYVRGRILVSEALANEHVTFKLPIYNFGSEDVSEVYARLQIYGPTGELLGEVETGRTGLNAKSEGTLQASWLAEVQAGRYMVRATIYFDGQKVAIEESFNVGELLIRIKDITSDPFKLGEIAKFNIDIESIWNQPLHGVFANAEVYDQQGGKVSSFKSTTTDLLPKEEHTLSAFWDTEGMTEGRYDIKFILQYGSKTTEKILQILLTLNGIETDLLGTGQAVSPDAGLLKRDSILIILVILLVLLNTYILYRFMLKKKSP